MLDSPFNRWAHEEMKTGPLDHLCDEPVETYTLNMNLLDENERLRAALRRLVDEAERVTWQGATDEPPTYPHLAAIIAVAKEALRTTQEDQRPYCVCMTPQRDPWTDSCAFCGGKIVTMAR